MKKFIVLVVALSFLVPGIVDAKKKKKSKYQVVEVTNGGSIKGKIKSAEKISDPVLTIDKDVKVCGNKQQAGKYVLSSNLEVKNVLVIVENVKKGKAAPKQDLVIDNVDCKFVPLIGIAYVKSKYIVKNTDPILHNTSLGKLLKSGVRRTVYNLALPFKDQVIKKPNRVAGLINIKCDAHPWMRSFIYSSRHPYVAITDASGNFEIKDLLPGKYKVKVWHEGYKQVVEDVKVSAGKASDLNVTLKR